jgi:DNA-binding PadR family transcriptional regulator
MNPFTTQTRITILELLEEHGSSYGLELIRYSGGRLKRGTIYIALGQLEERGLLRSTMRKDASHSGLPRPQYRLTASGRRVLRAWRVWKGAKL